MVQKVAVINDLSGFGRCSLTAALPVLSVMGVQPCPLPTAVLTAQTGFRDFFCDDFTDRIDQFLTHWGDMDVSFDGILTGYFASEEQIEKVLRFIRRFKKPHTKLLVDPIMGDGGEIYSTYTKALCDKVCELARHADVITPNLTELCILTGGDYQKIVSISDDETFFVEVTRMADSLLRAGVGAVAVTGLERGEYLYNGVFEKDTHAYHRFKAHGGRFSGTGDLFAATVCGGIIRGDDLDTAVCLAADFIERAVADTIHDCCDANHGVNFEKFLTMLAE